MNIGLLAFIFELVVLCACTSLCASAVVEPFPLPPNQDLSEWRRASDVAAEAAAAAAEEVCPSPSRDTVHKIQIAARAATAATATALGMDPMQLPDVPWVPGPPGGQPTAGEQGAAMHGKAPSQGGGQDRARNGGGAVGVGTEQVVSDSRRRSGGV